jgi:hypothetical protein
MHRDYQVSTPHSKRSISTFHFKTLLKLMKPDLVPEIFSFREQSSLWLATAWFNRDHAKRGE